MPERRPGRRGQPADQELGADVVGQVGDDPDRRRQVRQRVERQGVALEHGQPAGPGGGDLGERRQAAGVALDRDDVAGALGEQRAGQAAGAGADLEHVAGGEVAGAAGDLGGQVEVEQEVLAERLARREAVRGDDLAQRRQAVGAVMPRPRPGRAHVARELQRGDQARRVGDGPGRRCRRRCRGRARCARSRGRA